MTIFLKGKLILMFPVNLTQFLWKETAPVSNHLFPENQFGQYVLKRGRVINKIKKEMAAQLSCRSGTQSIYLSGCRGSGKTSLLLLLARSLKEDGYEVYFFRSANGIPQGASFAFESLLEDKTKKVAVLIDEVDSNPNADLFITLLKGAYPHLVTIGSAVPRYVITGGTGRFKFMLRMADLVLREDDEDFQELIQYCVGLNAASPDLTQDICNYLLKQCGGHTYPTLAFIEYFFAHDGTEELVKSMEDFQRYFCGPDFSSSDLYQSVRNRCFDEFLEPNTGMVVFRVLSGKLDPGDISTLTRLGWWNSEARDFISRFLMNACLSRVQPEADELLYLGSNQSRMKNTEMVIVEGLAGMDDSDFKCWRHSSEVKVENAVSFNWAYKARVKIPNAYLHFQERGVSGVVDFYLNGFADTAIEVMLNTTQTTDPMSTRQSQGIDGHLERFRVDKYPWKGYVLFNFAMNNDKIILPRDESAHDKVYTFVRSTNSLFRGRKLIKCPAIPKLSGGSRPFRDVQTRRVATMMNPETIGQHDTVRSPFDLRRWCLQRHWLCADQLMDSGDEGDEGDELGGGAARKKPKTEK